MSQSPDDRIAMPVQVEVKNWPDPPAKPPYVKNSTVKTWTLDPANVNFRSIQISDYEPKRNRTAIYVVDAAISVGTDPGTLFPDTSSATAAPSNGGYFPPAVTPYEFFGPDALWINAITAATRVTIVKEYC